MSKKPVLNIENAQIIFRNFSGRETQYNPAGSRNFDILIEDEGYADQLEKDGWNIKRKEREDGSVRITLNVQVSYKVVPPKIVMITGHNKKQTLLDEESVECLDYAEILSADITVNPYEWSVANKSGIKAYLKTMYITIEEDEWAEKYDQEG